MTTQPDPDDAKKEGRIARHSRLAREAWDEPASVLRWSRDWLVRLWVTKGGGFYGLGYVVTFVWLEIRAISGDIGGGGDIGDIITAQILQYIFRFSLDSLLNAIFAVIWPIYLLQWANGFGIVALIGAYAVYRYTVHPVLESRIPELKAAREAKEAKAARKKGGEAGT
jgi:hypothetical protein